MSASATTSAPRSRRVRVRIGGMSEHPRAAEESPWAYDQHAHEEQVHEHDLELGNEHDTEHGQLPQEERAEQRAPEAAEPPDDHDDETEHDDFRVHAGIES